MSEEGGEVVSSIHLVFAVLPCFNFVCGDSLSLSRSSWSYFLRTWTRGTRCEERVRQWVSRAPVSSLMTLAQVCKVSRLVVTFHRGAGWHHSLAEQGTHRGRRLLTCSHQISAVIIAASRGVVWCGVVRWRW